MEKTRSIAELLRYVEKHYHKEKAFGEKIGHSWVYHSHKDFLNQVKSITLYLNSLGIKKGDMVGILATPGVRWVIADLAIMACGGITVPLFANISNENFVFECEQTNLKTIFVLGHEAWDMLERHRELFDTVIAMDAPPRGETCATFDKGLEIGRNLAKKHPHLFDKFLDEINENDIATIVYTSGSTGVPKGVVLSQKNILCPSFHNFMGLTESDRLLSVLPLAHIFARDVTFVAMRWNVGMYFYNDVKTAGTAFQEIHPTITCFVPRILEKIYAKMVAKVNEAGFLKRSIGQWAFNIAMDEDFEKHFFHPLADKIVYKTLREAFGSHLRMIVSGAAPLNPSLNRFFNNIGMPVFEGYGMTEAMIMSVNTPERYKMGTVGATIQGVELKISSEGEIMVRFDGVMREYYKNPKATKEALDKEGWLHTGDKGNLDEDEFVKILGRVQELVKSSTGEWIAPVPLEQELGKAPFVEFSMIIAERRKFVSALIFPNFEVVHALKKSQNLEHLTDEEYLSSEFIKREMDLLIETINSHHNHWEQIHAYRFVLTPPTIESGELTPTLKIRRSNVEKKYKHLIDSMYPEDKSTKIA